MKIKIDFVTNSSSVGYIFAIPDWLDVSNDEKFKKECRYFSEETSYEENFKDATNILNRLKNGTHIIYTFDENNEAFACVREYLAQTKYFIASWDTGGGSGQDTIQNIPHKRINEVFMDLNKDLLDETTKIFKKDKE